MSRSAWTDLSPTLGHPSSHLLPLLAVAVLFPWLLRRGPRGGGGGSGSVDARKISVQACKFPEGIFNKCAKLLL